jgi:hypothetical protein
VAVFVQFQNFELITKDSGAQALIQIMNYLTRSLQLKVEVIVHCEHYGRTGKVSEAESANYFYRPNNISIDPVFIADTASSSPSSYCSTSKLKKKGRKRKLGRVEGVTEHPLETGNELDSY